MSTVIRMPVSRTASYPGPRQGRQISSRELSLFLGGSGQSGSDDPLYHHQIVRAGKQLIRPAAACTALYIVYAGFLKTVYSDEFGNEQILGFPMKGDLLGADGIGDSIYVNEVVALSDVDVIVVPFSDIGALRSVNAELADCLFRVVSQQLIQEQLALTSIGALSAQVRLARFLIHLSGRMSRQGYSADEFILHMGRQDMGNYLGMKIETVSRTLTALAKQGYISVNRRTIVVKDRQALSQLARQTTNKDAGCLRHAVSRKVPLQAVSVTPWSGLMSGATTAGVAVA